MSNTVTFNRSAANDFESSGRINFGYGSPMGLFEVGREFAGIHNKHSNSITHYEELFPLLARRIEKDCAHLSSVLEMERHPCYQDIVSMGRVMVPLILLALEDEPRRWWFSALQEITGKNAIKTENRGYVKKMAEDWFEWAESEGIAW